MSLAQTSLTNFIEMDRIDWEEKFKPIPNHIEKGTMMFETFGKELDFVRSCPPSNVWTLLDVDGDLCLSEGFHFVNRLGYYITEIPYEPDTNYQVM